MLGIHVIYIINNKNKQNVWLLANYGKKSQKVKVYSINVKPWIRDLV